MRVGVVVATRDRPAGLARVLRALAGQGAAEVVVVDDGSSPPAVVPAGVRLLRRAAPGGPAVARNEGWRALGPAVELVAFTDDDCVPAPGWVARLRAAALAAPGSCFVHGPVVPARAPAPFERTLTAGQGGPWYPTANVAYPRALLEALDGFDEAFTPAGEDTDLAWRALAAGVRVAWAPDARVEHAVHPLGPLRLARDARRWSSAVRVARRHPGIRAHLHRGIFWKREHEALLLALAGIAAVRRSSGLSLILLAPYARARRGRSLPGHLLVDCAELLAMVRGSVSARTLVL